MQKKDPGLLDSFEKLRRLLKDDDGTDLHCLDVGVYPSDYQERMELCRRFGIQHFSLGIHPCHAHEEPFDEYIESLEDVLRLAKDNNSLQKLVALGEIGIDLVRNAENIEVQLAVFKAQIRLANKFGLPIIIHNREAQDLVLQALREVPAVHGGILHCFSAGQAMAIELIDQGFFISFAANITYPSAQNLRDIAGFLPTESLLCETDSPYLSPQRLRSKPNNPCNVLSVYQTIAGLKNISVDDFALQIQENYSALVARSIAAT